MKLKLLTCVTNLEHEGLKKLEASLIKNGWDYKIYHDILISWNWGGWEHFYNWCKEQLTLPDGYTHFIGMDGFDTVCLAPMSEVIEKYKDTDCFIFSTEKACFPHPELAAEYPSLPDTHRWRYLNAGQFITPVEKFISMFEEREVTLMSQQWGHKKYLRNNPDGKVKLDTNCEIFQSIAFLATDEFSESNGRLVNNLTKTQPCIAHFNGHSDGSWVYKIAGV